ncbi:Uncharacterised protein [Raoultella planticola]|uniref:Uncharacterized protein n=1 Tax=Raoultella planticola TaxID=575 RepID=A0A485A8K0_RAOPL|nr:Uncharacterised protein [Raoultella planticola]
MNHLRAVPGLAASLAWSYRVLFWIGFGIATSLMFSSPAAAQSRQVGIDIPVQWVADIDGSMTLETFLALPESALTTGAAHPVIWLLSKNVLV